MNMEMKELFNISPAKSVYWMWLFKTVVSKFYFNLTTLSYKRKQETPPFLTMHVFCFFSFLSEIQI